MNPVPLFLIIVSLPLLLGGCGGEKKEKMERERRRLELLTRRFELLTAPTKAIPSEGIGYENKKGHLTLTQCFYSEWLRQQDPVRWAIPEKIDGHLVTVIGADSFAADSAGASHITIPNSVVRIERRTFQHSTHLMSLLIGDGLTSMGRLVFFYS